MDNFKFNPPPPEIMCGAVLRKPVDTKILCGAVGCISIDPERKYCAHFECVSVDHERQYFALLSEREQANFMRWVMRHFALLPEREQANFMRWVMRHCLVPSLTLGVGGVSVRIPKEDWGWIAKMIFMHVSEFRTLSTMGKLSKQLMHMSDVILESGRSASAIVGAAEGAEKGRGDEERVKSRKRQRACEEEEEEDQEQNEEKEVEDDEDEEDEGKPLPGFRVRVKENAAYLRGLLKKGSIIVNFEGVRAPPSSPIYSCGGCKGGGCGSASSSESGLSDEELATYESERASIGVPDGEGETFNPWEGDLEGLLGDVASLNEQKKEVTVFFLCFVLCGVR
jgi:hypothetical protein